MAAQRTLFDERPPHSGGITSRAAAEAIAPTAATTRELVFEFIAAAGAAGATREEIQTGLNLAGDTVRPRVWELIGSDRVEVTTETRKTLRGRAAEVLKVKT